MKVLVMSSRRKCVGKILMLLLSALVFSMLSSNSLAQTFSYPANFTGYLYLAQNSVFLVQYHTDTPIQITNISARMEWSGCDSHCFHWQIYNSSRNLIYDRENGRPCCGSYITSGIVNESVVGVVNVVGNFYVGVQDTSGGMGWSAGVAGAHEDRPFPYNNSWLYYGGAFHNMYAEFPSSDYAWMIDAYSILPAPTRCVIMDCSGLVGFPMIILRIFCSAANFLFCVPLLLGFLIAALVVYRIFKKKK